jgi:Fur family ferric uptake transcriptional regulator
MMDPEGILQELGLSKTRSRIGILEVLMSSSVPLSGGEIIALLPRACDKSTVYRTLSALFERDALQRVLIDHEVRYALREHHASRDKKGSDHVHFKCTRCDRVFCLKELIVEDYDLPEGFERKENQFLILGTCRTCRKK